MATGFDDDKFIKKPNTETEYTDQQVIELDNCLDPITGPMYFMENFMYIQHAMRGAILFQPYDYQRGLIECMVTNRKSVLLCGRQLGKTTCAVGYLLWYATFNPTSNILIASKTGKDAIDIMAMVRFAYEHLPDHIRAGARIYNVQSVLFDNGSKIASTTTTKSTGRGKALSLIYLDEFAFVDPPTLAKEIWTSLQPALSTGGGIIVTSTPNSDQDQFSQVWFSAQEKYDSNGNLYPGGVGKNGFGSFMATYKDHPDRTEEWAVTERNSIGEERFRREFNCEFIVFEETLISSIKLNRLKPKDPIKRTGNIRWFKKIKASMTYAVSLDTAMGSGGDNAAITIWELPSMEQVGEWYHNKTDIEGQMRVFRDILIEIWEQGEPDIYWSLETNTYGEAALVIIRETGEENFPGTFIHQPKHDGSARRTKGFVTTPKAKRVACAQLKNWVETDKLKINSGPLIAELKNYISKSNTYMAKQGCTDDVVASTLVFVRMAHVIARWHETTYDVIKGDIDDEDNYDEDDSTLRQPLPLIM